LGQLLRDHPGVPGLRGYLGLWYRMQAVMAMRFGETALARRRAWLAVRFGPVQVRNLYTLLLAVLPQSGRQALDAQLRRALRKTKDNAA
jgi:hypothetical protein